MNPDRWPHRRPYIPLGCDAQGRYPQAAPAAASTDIGADDDPPRAPMSPAERVILAAIYALSAFGVLSLLALVPWRDLLAALS